MLLANRMQNNIFISYFRSGTLRSEQLVQFITVQIHCLVLKGNPDPLVFNISSSVNRLCISFVRALNLRLLLFAAKDMLHTL